MPTMTYGEGVNLTEQQPDATADWDDFSVKDVIDLPSEATSRSVRAWFLAYDFTVRKFNKMPGHHAYDLTVKPTGATRIPDEAEAFRRIAEALESAGLKFAKDELALTRAGNLVRICFLGRLADVPESAGWFDVPTPETQTRL